MKNQEPKRLIPQYCGNFTDGFECGINGSQCRKCKKEKVIMTDAQIIDLGWRPESYPVANSK